MTDWRSFWLCSLLAMMLIWFKTQPAHAGIATDRSPLPEYTAKYSVIWHGFVAGYSLHSLLRQEDGSYFFKSETEPRFGFLPYEYYEHAKFYWRNHTIVPLEYAFDSQEGIRFKKGKLSFNWDTRQVTNDIQGKPWKLAISDGTQDKITHTLLMRRDVSDGKKTIAYPVADGGFVKEYRFEVLGDEVIETPIGELNTTKVHFQREDKGTTLWLAKDHHYILAKIQQYRKDKKIGEGEIVALEIAS